MASKKQISALMDGDLEQQDIVDDIQSDAELAGCWQRYHLIGDAMRRELPPAVDIELSDRIAAALEKEPAMVSPRAASPIPPRPSERSSARGRVVALFKGVGQYAIAASVALVVVLGVQQQGGQQQQDGTQPVLTTIPLSGNASPVSLQAAQPESAGLQEEQLRLEQQRRIKAYLQDHDIQQRFNAPPTDDSPVNEYIK